MPLDVCFLHQQIGYCKPIRPLDSICFLPHQIRPPTPAWKKQLRRVCSDFCSESKWRKPCSLTVHLWSNLESVWDVGRWDPSLSSRVQALPNLQSTVKSSTTYNGCQGPKRSKKHQPSDNHKVAPQSQNSTRIFRSPLMTQSSGLYFSPLSPLSPLSPRSRSPRSCQGRARVI